ncbi:SH3 domain-containing protein [Streptomyces sp. NPDC052301]|uniref:SH3 domain-containing protein n=1 Tax=Streptomyces sp. NPDC052301 TaxID=3365687 RepID=UPI0037D089B0
MIRRTLQSGLLATVAVLALLPTAAAAGPANAGAPRTAPGVTVPQHTHRVHHTGHSAYPAHRVHHRVHLRKHPTRRVHRLHRYTVRGTAYRLDMRTATYRFTPQGMTYRVTARRAPYRYTAPAVGRVATHRARLNVRSGPGTGYRVVGHRSRNRHVTLICKAYGSSVYGNRLWYRLPWHRGYVSARYVRPDRTVRWC